MSGRDARERGRFAWLVPLKRVARVIFPAVVLLTQFFVVVRLIVTLRSADTMPLLRFRFLLLFFLLVIVFGDAVRGPRR